MAHARHSTRSFILSLLSLLAVLGSVVFSVSWQQQVSQAAGAASHSQLKLADQPSNRVPPPISVYIGSFDDVVYAINASTGVRRWGKQTDNSVESSPEVA
jgi:hypothetical protein